MISDNVGIQISSSAKYNKQDGLIVHGSFKVLYPDIGIPNLPTYIPKQIVLNIINYPSYVSLKPFYDKIVFSDDIKSDGKYCTGKFIVNALEYVPFEKIEGNYTLLMSLGTHLSNIVEVLVE